MERSTVADIARHAERQLYEYLAKVQDTASRVPFTAGWRQRDPERLKVLSRLLARVRDVQRLLHRANLQSDNLSPQNVRDTSKTEDTDTSSQPPPEDIMLRGIAARLERIAHDPPALKTLDIDAGWELADAFKQDLLYLADDEYLIARLRSESHPSQEKSTDAWSKHYSDYPPNFIVESIRYGKSRKPGGVPSRNGATPAEESSTNHPPPIGRRKARVMAVRRLAFLYDQRAAAGRSGRMVASIRSGYLRRLSLYLAGLLVVLGVMVYVLGEGMSSVNEFVAVVFAGALGSMLAGVYKLRDSKGSIGDLRGFDAQFFAMPALGGSAAAVLLLFMRGGLVAIGGVDVSAEKAWLALAGLGFLAGFSEPFFLGTVERIAGGIRESKKE